jgi:hypothetical protein
MSAPITVTGLSNAEFFDQHACAGRIGLVGGALPGNRFIGRAQRHLIEGKEWSRWSHVFLFQGRRADGHHWIIESDLDVRRRHIRLGVQENRIEKYHADAEYPFVAVMDVGLAAGRELDVVAHALGLVADGARYSIRELLGTVWAMRRPGGQERDNVLAQEKSFYCSAFVRHVFGCAAVELNPSLAVKNTTPEDIWRVAVPHTKWLLEREQKPSTLRRAVSKVKERMAKRRAK